MPMPDTSDETTAGYVYILANSSLPGLVKIGLTRGTSKSRTGELSHSTSIPTPFIVAYDELVADCAEAERRLHEKFTHHRENPRREFSRLTPEEAIEVLQRMARFSPFVDDEVTRIDVLPAFDARLRRWLRRDLVGLSYLQTASTCALEMACQQHYALSDVKLERIDLGFIGDDNGFTFSCERDPEENARNLLSLDSYTLINCFDFIDHEAAT